MKRTPAQRTWNGDRYKEQFARQPKPAQSKVSWWIGLDREAFQKTISAQKFTSTRQE